jgi:hypothetical protein
MRLVPSLRLRLPKILGLLSAIFLSMVSLTRTASGQSSSGPPPPQPASADQEQFISYWTTETGWRSKLELRNNTASDLTVTPALRTANGVETALGPVTINPQEIKIIDLESGAIGGGAAPIRRYIWFRHPALSLPEPGKSLPHGDDPQYRPLRRLRH